MSEQQDRQFFRNFTLTLIALTIFGIFASIAGRQIAKLVPQDSGAEVVAGRVAPVGRVYTEDNPPPKVVNEAPPAVATAGSATGDVGKQTYDTVCMACHGAGVAGAPKLGDKAAWEPRLAQGMDVLHKHAIEGFQGGAGVMPARGGKTDLSDDAVKAAVDYILAESGGPARAAPAAEAPAAPAEAAPTEAAPAAEAASAAEAAAPAEAAPAAEAAAPEAAAAAGGADEKGKQVYDTVCMACHAAGIAGAPKFGDKAAWDARLGQGMDVLYEHSIKGFMGAAGMMPPKGGRTDLADDDVKAAVDYMVSAVK
jgi:cytochrome c5